MTSAKSGMNMGHIFKIFQNWRETRPNFTDQIDTNISQILESLQILENDVNFFSKFCLKFVTQV